MPFDLAEASKKLKLPPLDSIIENLNALLASYDYNKELPRLPLIRIKSAYDSIAMAEALVLEGMRNQVRDSLLSRESSFASSPDTASATESRASTNPTPISFDQNSTPLDRSSIDVVELDDIEPELLALQGPTEEKTAYIFRSASASPTSELELVRRSVAQSPTENERARVYHPHADTIVILYYIRERIETLRIEYFANPEYNFLGDLAILREALTKEDVATQRSPLVNQKMVPDALKNAKLVLKRLSQYTPDHIESELRIVAAREAGQKMRQQRPRRITFVEPAASTPGQSAEPQIVKPRAEKATANGSACGLPMSKLSCSLM